MLNGAMPGFEISGGLLLAAIRGAFDAALFSAFGTLLFSGLVLGRARARTPADAQGALDRRLLLFARGSLGAALLTGAGWLVLQAALMADASSLEQGLGAMPTVLASTGFGHILALQAALLGLAMLALGRGPARQRAASWPAAAALLLQAAHGHAMSMYGGASLLLLSDGVHLLAGGAWLGGLLPFLLSVRMLPPRAAATAARSFSLLGKWCVGLMAITAGFQAWILVGTVPALIGTAYGWIACIKLLIFGVLLGFACLNRYRLAPALLGGSPERARRRLVSSVAVQTGFGLAVLLAAGVLSSLPPGMHEQAVWPFSWQFSLVTVREDADLGREVLRAVLALAVAALLAVVAWFLRRLWARLLASAVAMVLVILAVPHLDLLFIPGTPTSFYQSPSGFAGASIVQGASLYPKHCAACHGADGHGDGPAAASLPVPPADLTAGHLWMHSDGELFWWLTHGIEAPLGGMAMPGFAAALTPDERWALIDFIRARNAGLARRSTGAWPVPVQAPSWQAECAGGRLETLAEMRGRIVRLVIGTAPDFRADGTVTVRVTSDPAAHPDVTTCIARDDTILGAYGIIAGLDQRDLPDTQFLIDAGGWLRTVLRPGRVAGNGAARLRTMIEAIRQHPLQAPAGMGHMRM